MTDFRVEKDFLGNIKVPADAYYGVQTARAMDNFPVSGLKENPLFIDAYIMLKRSAALANGELGRIENSTAKAIVQAADEILSGEHRDQFVVDVYQAGAGTSFNMNCNEVLANRANEILGSAKGSYQPVHPNDHVNHGQSTNDTFPTAMHVGILMALRNLESVVGQLADAFEEKGTEFAEIPKIGRTHLQDAVPMWLGQEFSAYGGAVGARLDDIRRTSEQLLPVALGGTALGTGLNAHPEYREKAVKYLGEISGLSLKPAGDLRLATQSMAPVGSVSSSLKGLALELIRIANDLRLLSSGPTTGLGEINLPAVQPGSSIMPGKVNPVMAECLNMIAFQICGNDLTVSMAVQAGQMELNVMMPVMVHNVMTSVQLLVNYLPEFRKRCVEGISANEEKCIGYLEKCPAIATALNPKLGYHLAAEIAKESVRRSVPVKQIVQERGLLTEEEIEEVFDIKYLTAEKHRV